MTIASITKNSLIGALGGALVGILACCWITSMRSLFPLPIHGVSDRIAFFLCPFLWLGFIPWHHGIPAFYATVILLNALPYCAVFAMIAGLFILTRNISRNSRIESRS